MKTKFTFHKKWIIQTKGIVGIFLLTCILSCSDAHFIEKPKKLISKDEMAELLAELALNDQTSFANPIKGNMESGTRYIFKKRHLKGEDFVESYKYYSVTKKMENIIEKSQKIIKEKDPSAEDFIEKKLKTDAKLPTFAR